MQATKEFLEYAMIFNGVANDPEARMKALFEFKYGGDFIQMLAFHDRSQTPKDILVNPDAPAVYFTYAAKALVWKLPETWEVT